MYLKTLVGLAIKLVCSYFKEILNFKPKCSRPFETHFQELFEGEQQSNHAALEQGCCGRSQNGEKAWWGRRRKEQKMRKGRKKTYKLSHGFLSGPLNIVYVPPFLFSSLHGTKALCALSFSFKNLFP